MQFQAKSTDAVKCKADALVVGVYDNKQLSSAAEAVDKAGNGALNKLLSREKFNGARGATLTLHHNVGQQAQRLIVLGLGKPSKGKLAPADFSNAMAALPAVTKNLRHLALDLNGIEITERDDRWQARQLVQALSTSLWRFTEFKSDKGKPPALSKVTALVAKGATSRVGKALDEGAAVAEGINYARELGNSPGNVCTPEYLVKQARALARANPKLSVKVLSEKQMQSLGMGAFLSVSAGSDQPGYMIVMEYKGAAKTAPTHALVGKGITFDTGGISLKPGMGMDEMKFDMCGAASVFGAVKTLTQMDAKVNLVAVVAAAENMPSGGATKPGDIVTTMSGQTVEILNTDAEGRLVLCDALSYVQRYKPKTIIDIATLTGACVIALGSHAHGLYSNDDALAQALLNAGENADDRAWRMPLWSDYQKQLDSNFADMANIGGREAGSVTAACFLARFTRDCRWAHLDIAGTAWKSGGAKGATGRPVSLLVEYLLSAK